MEEGHRESQLVLRDDEYIMIVQPYFKLATQSFRVKLIEMLRDTVLISRRSFEDLTRLYKFMIMEFIQKELDPSRREYSPSQETNFIIENVYFVVDHVVMALKNDWNSLYHYIVMNKAFLEDAKEDLALRTSRPF